MCLLSLFLRFHPHTQFPLFFSLRRDFFRVGHARNFNLNQTRDPILEIISTACSNLIHATSAHNLQPIRTHTRRRVILTVNYTTIFHNFRIIFIINKLHPESFVARNFSDITKSYGSTFGRKLELSDDETNPFTNKTTHINFHHGGKFSRGHLTWSLVERVEHSGQQQQPPIFGKT